MTHSPRTTGELQAVRQAAVELGLAVDDIVVVSQGRTGVYRVVVRPKSPLEQFPVLSEDNVAAARVTASTESVTPAAETHRILRELYRQGAPVAGPLHENSVFTSCGEVGFWTWLTGTSITAYQWGTLTGSFHRAGRRLLGSARPYDPARVLTPRLRRARQLVERRGHPLFGARALVRSFEVALDEAVQRAATATDAFCRVLALGDNQPGNVMTSPVGPVLNDFERVAAGPAALDLAAVGLGVDHFGYSESVVEDFRAGYGLEAPTLAAARPFIRIRELSGVIIAMIESGGSPEMEREMQVRAVSITDPGEGDPWTYVGRPDAMRLASQPVPWLRPSDGGG